jgi:hypothetical protein
MNINDGSSIATASAKAMPEPDAIMLSGSVEVLFHSAVDRAGGGEVIVVFEVNFAANGAEILGQETFQEGKIKGRFALAFSVLTASFLALLTLRPVPVIRAGRFAGRIHFAAPSSSVCLLCCTRASSTSSMSKR